MRNRLVHGPGDRIFLASRGEPPQEAATEAAIEAEYNDLKPSDAKLAVRKTAVFIGYEPGVFYYVRVARGSALYSRTGVAYTGNIIHQGGDDEKNSSLRAYC